MSRVTHSEPGLPMGERDHILGLASEAVTAGIKGLGTFTCQSEIVVYSIICRRCGCLYIGETGRRLRERFSEHLRSVRNKSPGFPVAEHFNSASHSLNDIMICGLKRCSGDNTRRKKQEMRLIFELGTLKPNVLNVNFRFI